MKSHTVRTIIFGGISLFLGGQGSLATEILFQHEEQSPLLRFRGPPCPDPSASSFPQGSWDELDLEDQTFSSLGRVWADFKAEHYKGCFRLLFSLRFNPPAMYLLGRVYEEGLDDTASSKSKASKWYTLALTNARRGSFLSKKSEEALQRLAQ